MEMGHSQTLVVANTEVACSGVAYTEQATTQLATLNRPPQVGHPE